MMGKNMMMKGGLNMNMPGLNTNMGINTNAMNPMMMNPMMMASMTQMNNMNNRNASMTMNATSNALDQTSSGGSLTAAVQPKTAGFYTVFFLNHRYGDI